MKIVADENIPLLQAFFGELGELHALPGRTLSAADVKDADVLLVRSVTRVNESLLAGSRVRFVGTATIGTDHLDTAWLDQAGIRWSAAPGCNARAVAEYVAAALLELHDNLPANGLLGVVGLGNVGRQVAAMARMLGWRVMAHDPFLAEAGLPEADVPLVPLATLFAEADVVCLHTPLTRSGPHPTWRMVGAELLGRMPAHALLLNAGRGGVVDNQALLQHLRQQARPVVLDVWENEPAVDPALMAEVAFGSPHIAGYSQDGKWRGTQQVYEALCGFLGQSPRLDFRSMVPAEAGVTTMTSGELWPALREAVRAAFDIRVDDGNLRQSLQAADPAAAFDQLRRHYRPRREFPAHRLLLPDQHPARATLGALGFRLQTSPPVHTDT